RVSGVTAAPGIPSSRSSSSTARVTSASSSGASPPPLAARARDLRYVPATFMSLAAGTRLGPYEVVTPIGAGGMGEVYRAKDTRLDREVALKVLPEHLTGSGDLRSRFEREARAISSLQHPHICTLHDVGREGETDFLVMELLDGESLADRLQRGPLPTDEVLRYGTQIAYALETAHASGIVHRDLKPGNVFLTERGVKLLDFGLAKLHPTTPSSSRSQMGQLPTEQLSAPLTSAGMIL